MRYVSFYHRHTNHTPIHHSTNTIRLSFGLLHSSLGRSIVRPEMGSLARKEFAAADSLAYPHNAPNRLDCVSNSLSQGIFQGAIGCYYSRQTVTRVTSPDWAYMSRD